MMKALLTIAAALLLVALIPAAWTFMGWAAITAYELVTASEVTDTFWNWRHFGAGLGLAIVGGLFARSA